MKKAGYAPLSEVLVEHVKLNQKHDMKFHHYHDIHEILLMLGGKRHLFYGNTSYTLERGSLVVINPLDIHYTISSESDYYERYLLHFRLEKLSIILDDTELNHLKEMLKPCVLRLTEEQITTLVEYLEHTKSIVRNNDVFAKKMLYSSIFLVLMYILSCTNDVQTMENSISPTITNALIHINTHFYRHITLDELSETARLSKFHFSRTFKEVMGLTVMEYLNNYRLSKAHNLLVNTSMTIEDIATETGFASAQNLRNAFCKTYGMSPSKFRKSRK